MCFRCIVTTSRLILRRHHPSSSLSPALSGLGVAPVHVLEIPVQQPRRPASDSMVALQFGNLVNPLPTGSHYNERTIRNNKIAQVAGISWNQPSQPVKANPV